MNFVLRAMAILLAFVWFNTAWAVMAIKPLMYFNIPSLLLAIVVPLFLMVGLQGMKALTFYWQKGEAKNWMIDLWSRMLIAGGVTGSIMGIVDMLANMRDPKAIGPALAVALLTILYAFTAKLFLLEPFRDIGDPPVSDNKPPSDGIALAGKQKGILIASTVIATLVTLVLLISVGVAIDEYTRQSEVTASPLESEE